MANKLKKETKNKLKQIEALFTQAQDLYNSIPPEDQEKIQQAHNETATLAYCLRWGLQASEELQR